MNANNKKTAAITFYGGAETVTGANFLLEGILEEKEKLRLLVDCGMEQGNKFCKDCNFEKFPYAPDEIDVLIVTHAHMDHVGRIPQLVRLGFKGVIYSTDATKVLSEIMLEDAQHILAIEAKRAKKEPLYGSKDVKSALNLWNGLEYHTQTKLPHGFSFTLRDAGHVLGSAIVEVTHGNKKIVFSGDLGNSPSPLLRDSEVITDADYLIVESVYGDRNHEQVIDRQVMLKEVIEETIKNEGVLLIPAFSIERTQVLLYELNEMIEGGTLPHISVYLDSPLAIRVTEIYKRFTKHFNESIQKQIQEGDNIFDFPKLKFTERRSDSEKIASEPSPKVIIAGSGMSHGGRIIDHEKKYLSSRKNTLLFIGFQAAGSLGRKIQDGLKKIRIEDKDIEIRANIRTISGYSAHKDMDGLVEFVDGMAENVQKVFVTMGEPKSSLFLAQRLREYLGVTAVVPKRNERFIIDM